MRAPPFHLPASAFDQHYTGNSSGAANLSDRLLDAEQFDAACMGVV